MIAKVLLLIIKHAVCQILSNGLATHVQILACIHLSPTYTPTTYLRPDKRQHNDGKEFFNAFELCQMGVFDIFIGDSHS